MVLNVHTNHKAYLGTGEKEGGVGGGGGWGGGGGMGVGEEVIYISLHCHNPNAALRWAAMLIHCEGQSHTTVSTNRNPSGRERRAEAVSSPGLQPTFKISATALPVNILALRTCL